MAALADDPYLCDLIGYGIAAVLLTALDWWLHGWPKRTPKPDRLPHCQCARPYVAERMESEALP